MDNRLLPSWSFKMSDILSDKFSALRHATPQYALARNAYAGGSDLMKPVTHRASKGGVAPALPSFPYACSPVLFGACIGLICLTMAPRRREVIVEVPVKYWGEALFTSTSIVEEDEEERGCPFGAT